MNSFAAEVHPKAVAKFDPLPLQGIAPALLNSADIAAYAEQLQPPLFEPFYRGHLKPATYEVPFEGDIFLWRNEKLPMEKIALSEDACFTIDANSIVYVSPKTYFRIPSFLALRFNLHIKLVHRGLLLGTGPLVDPGFAGRLLIPVHNLTSQPLIVRGGEGFIWIEVTKISPQRFGTVPAPFPEGKKTRSPEDYLEKANKLQPIVSTLRVTSDRLEAIWDKMLKISIGGAIALAVSLAGLTFGCLALIRDAHQYVNDTRKVSADDLEKVQKKMDQQQAQLESLTIRAGEINKISGVALDRLREQFDRQQAEIAELKSATTSKSGSVGAAKH